MSGVCETPTEADGDCHTYRYDRGGRVIEYTWSQLTDIVDTVLMEYTMLMNVADKEKMLRVLQHSED